MTCTFFGHRVVTNDVKTRLRVVITDLIVHHAVDVFYVGNQGGFDEIVSEVLRELQTIYPIDYAVVLAYFPVERDGNGTPNPPDTIYPEGLETVPKRFAICYRNRWMLERADYVVTYVTHRGGSGAARYQSLAEQRGKKVISLGGA